MNPLRTSSALLLALANLVPGRALGQTEPAVDQARAWISERGWSEGRNADGSFVAIGTAMLDRSASDQVLARSWAFDLACLDAKNSLAERLAAEVSATSKGASSQTDPLRKRITDKVPAAPATVARETLSRATWVVARTLLAGVVAKAQFSSDTMLAVVVRCTDLSIAAAEAASRHEAMPAHAGLEPIDDIRQSDASSLLKRMGVQVMRDLDGSACLVAFAQSGVNDEPLARDRAASRARMRARAALARFLAEMADGRSVLQSCSSLEMLADGRSRFEAEETLQQELSTATDIPGMTEPETVRVWEATDGRLAVVGVVVLLRSGARSTQTPRSAAAGDDATVRIDGDRIEARAVGVGRFESLEGEAPVHPALRRCRAIRAGVIAAKGEIARRLRQKVAATLRSKDAGNGAISAESEVVTQVLRQTLAGAHVERVEDLGGGDHPEVRVHVSIRGSSSPSDTGGLLSFDTTDEAAARLAHLAMDGLCGTGPIQAFVGTLGNRRLVTFGIGLGAGAQAATLARVKAAAAVQSAARGDIEGVSSLRSTLEFPDALSTVGCEAAMRESLLSTWTQTSSGLVRLNATPATLQRDGVAVCVAWSEEP